MPECPSPVQRRMIAATSDYVRAHFNAEPTGHDWWHSERVRKVASKIALAEGGDLYITELAALLHDVDDFKFSGSFDAGARAADAFLGPLGVDPEVVSAVSSIIARVSFKGAHVPDEPMTIEGQCVQDADRLDAIGALGIARTFAYGGHAGRPIHDPSIPPVLHETADAYRSNVGTTINHFHEKLLLLQARLNTETARHIAVRRHNVMLEFLAEFEEEWNCADIELPAM